MTRLNDPYDEPNDGPDEYQYDWSLEEQYEDPDAWLLERSELYQLQAKIANYHPPHRESIVAGKFITLLLRLSRDPAVLKDPHEYHDLRALVDAMKYLWVGGLSPFVEAQPKPEGEIPPEIDLDSLYANARVETHYEEDSVDYPKPFSTDQPRRDLEALETEIDSRGEPFDLETLCKYTGTDKLEIVNMLIMVKKYIASYPVILIDLGNIAWVKEGSKGRGKSHEFRRANAPQFDCLDHLLSLEAREVHRILVPGKKVPTVRMLLRKVRNEIFPIDKPVKKSRSTPNPDSIAKPKPKSMPEAKALAHCDKNYGGFYSSYGIYFNGRNGIAIDHDGKVIKSLFSGTTWEGGLHAKMMRRLGSAGTLSWNELQLPYEGKCTLISWNSLIIDLDESRD